MNKAVAKSDFPIYLLGAVFGIGAGILDVKIGDLLLTALVVMMSTMLLGVLRPERPWRWIVTVGVFIPAIQLLAYVFLTEKPYAAQIYESFLGFLTGCAGAYGGSVMRRTLGELFREHPKTNPPAAHHPN
jgi:hypothetical protein